jgi:hypothetical protein
LGEYHNQGHPQKKPSRDRKYDHQNAHCRNSNCIQCLQLRPTKSEHFLELNTNALEKLEDVFLKDLPIMMSVTVPVRKTGSTIPTAKTEHHSMHFSGCNCTSINVAVYLNTLLVNVTMKIKMIICKPNVLKKRSIPLQ